MQVFRLGPVLGVGLLLCSSGALAQSSFPSSGEDSSAANSSPQGAADGASPRTDSAAPPRSLTPRLRPRPGPPAPAPAAPVSPPESSASRPSTPAPPPTSSERTQPLSSPPVVVGAPAVGAGFQPPLLPAFGDLDPPPGYEARTRLNGPLLLGGGLVFGMTYGTSLIYGAGKRFENGLGALAVPILGPWMALGSRDFSCNVDTDGSRSDIEESQREAEACIANQTATAGILVGLGVGQLVGASLLTIGLLDRERQWLRTDLAGVETRFDVIAAPGWAGLGASGQF